MVGKFERSEVVTWESRLQRAYTVEDLLGVVKDFLATWGPEELAALPEHLRPGHIRDGDDVALYAFRLMSRHSLPDGNSHILLRMNTFFGTASHRLSQILSIASAEARARANENAAS
jgi:hypothetical protein